MADAIKRYDSTIINGSTVWMKEFNIGNDIVQEIHFPVRDGQFALDLYHKHFWFGNYTEQEIVYGPGRPVTIRLKIKRNKHRTFIITQTLRFGEV